MAILLGDDRSTESSFCKQQTPKLALNCAEIDSIEAHASCKVTKLTASPLRVPQSPQNKLNQKTLSTVQHEQKTKRAQNGIYIC